MNTSFLRPCLLRGGGLTLATIVALLIGFFAAPTAHAAPPEPVITSFAGGAEPPSHEPVVVSGTAQASSTIQVRDYFSSATCTTSADLAGNWSCSLGLLAVGVHQARVTATDATGTSAEAIATFNVIEIPAAPVITSPGNGSTVTGAPGASYTTVTISGTATAVGSISLVWVYQADGTYLCRSFAVNGTWSCTTNLTTPGTYTAVAYWSGIDAGIGEPSNQVTFTYEVARAQAPTITTPANGSTVTGAPGASYTTVTISGTAPAYPNLHVIRVYRADGTYLCLSFVSNGTWSCTTNIRDPGAYTVVAYWDAIDSGTGDPSNQVTFTYARARAQAPTITTPTTGSTITGGVGASSTDVTISGTAPAYANLNLIWVYEADGTYLCRSFVSNGTWSCTASIRDPRAYTVVAYWEGIDSGTGDPSNAVTFTYEIASPDPPVITTPATGTTITSALGTSYTTVTVSGTATPSGTVDTVRVYRDDGTYVCTSLVTNGTWSCTTQVTDPGNYTLIAYWEDITSGIGDPSTPVTFTYALIPTDQPLITTPSAGAVVYNTTTPTIAGTATNGSTVTVYVDGTAIGTTVSTGGAWTFTPPTPLGEGSHSVYVTADAGSGPSDPSATITFAIDTTPPAAPSITAPARGAVIGTATPAIRGTAELGNTVNVYVDGALYCTVNGGTSADPWTCEGAVLADGEHSVYAIAIDGTAARASPPPHSPSPSTTPHLPHRPSPHP